MAKSPPVLGKPLSTSCRSAALATGPFAASPVWEVWGTFGGRDRAVPRRQSRTRSQGTGPVFGLLDQRRQGAVRDPLPCHHQPCRTLPRSFCAAARALDRPPLVAPLFAHRTKRSPDRPRRTPPAFRHGMGNGQRSPRYRRRAKIHPPPSRTASNQAGSTQPPKRWKRQSPATGIPGKNQRDS